MIGLVLHAKRLQWDRTPFAAGKCEVIIKMPTRKASPLMSADKNDHRHSSQKVRSELDNYYFAFDHFKFVATENNLQKESRIICKCAEAG